MSVGAAVPKGYKQTDVGVIPQDWGVKPLHAVCTIDRGKFSVRPRNDPKYYGGTTPFLQTGDITGASGQVTGYSQTLNAQGVKVSRVFPAGTLFFTIAANIGDIASAPFDAACPDSIVGITPAPGVDAAWLAHELRSHKAAFEELATKNAQSNINLEKLRPYRIACPSLNEQRAIADALGDADALLDALDRLIAKKRDRKQATMQQLLTARTRLPGFTDEWQVTRVGRIADIRSGGTPSTRRECFWDGTIPWCTPTDITALRGHKYLRGTARTITEEGLAASSAEIVPANSIVMTSRATIGECAVNVVPMTTNQGFKNLLPLDGVDTEFLYYLLTTQKPGFTRLCGGSTFLELSKTQLAAYKLTLPPIVAEQTAIATVLSDMDAELAALEARRAKIRDLKQAMMQELLTGRTRLV